MVENDNWGEARAQDRARRRRTRTIVAAVALIAVPVLIPFFAGMYAGFTDAHNGVARSGDGLPAWVSIATVAGFALAAAIVAGLFYRSSDEFERRLLTNAAAVFGITLLILSPALDLIGHYGGGDGMQMIAWIAALMGGLGAYVTQRVRG